jgi:hypothetical protein
MQEWLRSIGTLVGYLLPRASTPLFRANAGTDWLPPVLGQDDLSGGLFAAMADASSAWYFERR